MRAGAESDIVPLDRTFRGTRVAAADEVTRRFAAFPLMQALLLVATMGLCSALRDDIPWLGGRTTCSVARRSCARRWT